MDDRLEAVMKALRLLARATGYLEAGDGGEPLPLDRDEGMNLIDDAREVLDGIAAREHA